jgi:GT2 family glycosyltransferase
MISVVYSTRKDNPEYKKHISNTISVKDYEIIQIENNGIMSLTEAYNKGLEQSKNNIVAFIHDDLILPKGWGKNMLSHFNKSDYGILGVAGTTNLPESGRWWEDNTKMVGIVKHSNDGKVWESKYSINFGKDIIETVVLDGLFFVVDKTKIKTKFNEDLKGFHFYDIDFTFNNHISGVRVGVVFDVRITHMSIGQTNQEWESNRIQFTELYKDHLPKNLNVEIRYDKTPIKKLKNYPKVSVVIPTKSNIDLLTKCVDSIFEKDDYHNLVVLIADTGSTDSDKQSINELILKHSTYSDRPRNVELIEYDYYNFAKINNDVVKNHVSDDTELLLFCNNDIELINDSISRMVNFYLKNKMVGTIGARLHFEDGSIQHGGIMVYMRQDRRVGVGHHGFRSYYNYYPQTKEVFGNTAAFMMIKKDIFNKIGGFNQGYQECFEDVELNIDCLNRNLKNYFVPDAVCYHYESQTRNKDGKKWEKEAEDYTKRIVPYILANKKTYNYFENIKANDLEMIVRQTFKNLVQ